MQSPYRNVIGLAWLDPMFAHGTALVFEQENETARVEQDRLLLPLVVLERKLVSAVDVEHFARIAPGDRPQIFISPRLWCPNDAGLVGHVVCHRRVIMQGPCRSGGTGYHEGRRVPNARAESTFVLAAGTSGQAASGRVSRKGAAAPLPVPGPEPHAQAAISRARSGRRRRTPASP